MFYRLQIKLMQISIITEKHSVNGTFTDAVAVMYSKQMFALVVLIESGLTQ